MHNTIRVNNDVTYIGASDRRIALFENAYPVGNGMSYNSYLVTDKKTVLLDTCDSTVEKQFLENLENALAGKALDHIIINHMEPDHSASLKAVLEKYPSATVIGTMQVSKMVQQFTGIDITDRFNAVKEGDTLNTGSHTFRFITAPMVHWPEVMMTYDETDKALYSADAFGRFGALSGNIFDDEASLWNGHLSSARRYYANIVGKYGIQVQAVLKKAAALDIKMICPLHGPILRENLAYYLDKYDKWSSYTPEDNSVIIAYGSVYGGTENAADILAAKLSEKGVKNIRIYDVSKTHYSKIVAEAFRAKALVFAAPTIDGGLFTEMETVLNEIKNKNLANRTVAFIENGTWGPLAAKSMAAYFEGLKNINILPEKCTVRSTVSEANLEELDKMADSIAACL
ncbi:MAG: FprA family A-type flavoprotein [Eubacterium sp.]|nr:FprA family A-type flavoprotein [Eubacterium sp.]